MAGRRALYQVTCFSLGLQGVGRGQGTLAGGSFIRTLTLPGRLHPHGLITPPPKAPHPNTIVVRFQHMNSGRDTDAQITAEATVSGGQRPALPNRVLGLLRAPAQGAQPR